jgi:hypothetical protein
MVRMPQGVRTVLHEWSVEFSQSVWPRFQILLCAEICCVGRRTVCRLLRIAGTLTDGHLCSYHRVLSRSRRSSLNLARILAQHVVGRFLPRGTIALCSDDTVTQYPGKEVYGKGRQCDGVRSTHSYIAWRWGHKWVVLAILVQLRGRSRALALPVLCALDRLPEANKKRGHRHKTPCDLMRQLLCVLLRWFPQRKYLFSVDGGYGTHALARFVSRHPRLTHLRQLFGRSRVEIVAFPVF